MMDDTLIQQFRTGEKATFIIFNEPNKGTGIPISLAGFTEGYDRLQ